MEDKMGLKDKMMDSMFTKMDIEEKKKMMDNMMNNFFTSMTDEEKQEMMKEMMPKMMKQMMGEGGGMMKMMGSMMSDREKGESEGFNPTEMCEKMMSTISESRELAGWATPEIRGLFKDWVQQMNEELLSYINSHKNVEFDQIASHFKISLSSVIYLLSRLAEEGKVKLKLA